MRRTGPAASAKSSSRRPPPPSSLPSAKPTWGIYCFRAARFWQHVGRLAPTIRPGEYYLTDMVADPCTAPGHAVEACAIDDARELLGINTRVELAEVDRLLRDRKLRELMLAGVTIEKPETVTIDADVAIGIDTVVEPFAQILGRTTIGENCRIGAGAIVRDSRVGDDVEIGPFTLVDDSRLERGRARRARSRACAWTTTSRRARTSATSWS